MPWASVLGTTSVPVLCYHNLGGNGVPRAAFEAQMRWLAGQGVRSLTLTQLADFIAGNPLDRQQTGPGVLITFDDGFRDLHTFAGPLLASLGLNAVVFAINNRLRPDDQPGREDEIVAHEAHWAFVEHGNRSAWCSAAELAQWAGQGVLEIGGHSHRHVKGPVSEARHAVNPVNWTHLFWQQGMMFDSGTRPVHLFPELAPELAGPLWLEKENRLETDEEFSARAEAELTACRQGLEQAVGCPVTALAWPWGEWHSISRQAAHRAGFSMAFTLKRGPLAQGADPMHLPRLEVRKNKGMAWFKSRLAVYSRRTLARAYNAIRL